MTGPDMEGLLDTAPCGFLRVADDGSILLVNQTLAEALGCDRAGLEGQHVDAVLSAGARIFYQTHVFPLLRANGRVEEIYLSLKPGGGGDLPVLLNAVRRQHEGRGVSDWIVVPMRQRTQFEDELLQAKKVAEEADRAKTRFLSMMSHDLRAPLSGIGMASQVLASGASGPVTDRQRYELGLIQEASEYVLRLLSDILDFARLRAGRTDLRLMPVPVQEVYDRVVPMVNPLFERAGVSFVAEPCASWPSALGHPDRIQQIVLNLLTNAAKYTGEGGEVVFTCEEGGGRVQVHVRDTGPGIPAERIEQIFDPFTQLEDPPGGGRREGVGLGLAISRELARAMGGDLTVESAVGVGSTFTLSLAETDGSTGQAGQPPPGGGDADGLRAVQAAGGGQGFSRRTA